MKVYEYVDYTRQKKRYHLQMPTHAFSALSLRLTAALAPTEKKNGGIYFTPPSCVQRILALLRSIGGRGSRDDDRVSFSTHSCKNILEPSCGSGEFISALMTEYPDANITGVEFHPDIYKEVSRQFANTTGSCKHHVKIEHCDFLTYRPATGAAPPDLIIGNPPYFVMKKEDVAPEYYPFFEGRPNIFILFIIKSAQLLRTGGVIAFVLPSSFMNSQYYDKTRKYLSCHFAIRHIARWGVECDGGGGAYLETQQDTLILILQKCAGAACAGAGGYVFEKSGLTIFTDDLPRLTSLYSGSRSLHELGFNVSIGTVVWNQCKSLLTNDTTKTRLVYSSNIQDGKFIDKTYKNPGKKTYIDKPGIHTPMIVLNRGYGVGKYQFEYCLLTPDVVGGGGGYLIENHLICITHGDTTVSPALPEFHRVIQSFQDPRTQEFISRYCGNNAMNATELNHMLPIYDI